MGQTSVVDEAENAILSYEKLRDEIDPTLAYSWRADDKTGDLLDKTEKKLISFGGTIQTACKVLRDELSEKKDSFQEKMNQLWAKVHTLDEKNKNAGDEIKKYYKERILALNERIKAIKEAEKNEIESVQMRLAQFEKDRANIESYLSEIRSKRR